MTAFAPIHGARGPERYVNHGRIWPARPELRAALLAQGVPYLTADLLATLTQSGDRPDLDAVVSARLGAPEAPVAP